MENHRGADNCIFDSISVEENSYDAADDEGEYAFAIDNMNRLERWR